MHQTEDFYIQSSVEREREGKTLKWQWSSSFLIYYAIYCLILDA